MLHALSAVRPARRLSAVIAALLCAMLVAGPVAPALSQTLVAPAQTKEEAAKEREAAEKAAAEEAGGGGISTAGWLGITSIVLIAGATIYMVRDSRIATGGGSRNAPARPPVNPRTTRGAPQTMFEGEAKPGGQVGKQAKRNKGKRQRQARKANRPR